MHSNISSVFVQDMNVVVVFHPEPSRSSIAFDFCLIEKETEARQGLAKSLTEHLHWFPEGRIVLYSEADITIQRHKSENVGIG